MQVIVTAGPTYEPLDQVRRLTNFSTGQLGCELAVFLAQQGGTVTLLLGEQAVYPPPSGIPVERFSSGADLRSRLQARAGEGVAAVFHAAAVGDFGFGSVFQRDAHGTLTKIKSGKFSTRAGTLLVELVPTPKIISELRGWFPNAFLAGWKYEVDGGRESVLAQAAEQMRQNQTSACVCNGPAYGKGFGLLAANASLRHFDARPELFAALLQSIAS